ncbi:hypothetical protein [Archangium violaceum]|uniref:hypothetical protein n=1 Tax=Archangium violaceum TaxID=83451 RepID=UPI000698D22F|nr:hypothetical protein [Archangium violaceum]
MINKFLVCLALVVLHSPWMASAAEPSILASAELESSYPWVRNVSLKEQDAAYALFREGNGFLKNSIFIQAVEKYRQALKHWDHPAIHYNLALALMNFEQPIEAYTHLEAAMRYGPEPLDQERFERARTYKDLLDKQIVRVSVRCDEPGTIVTLDGQTLFVAPGHYEGLARTGIHSVVARKDGHLTYDKSQTWVSGKQVELNLHLVRREDATQYRRQWDEWKPWAVVGSGLAAAVSGGVMHLGAASTYGAFDTKVRECGGCMATPELAAIRSRGDNLKQAAMGAYALGGAALVTGAVLLYLNQPQAHLIDPYQSEESVNVVPILGGMNGVQATFRF